jgi:DNA polymerase-3 subunit delta
MFSGARLVYGADEFLVECRTDFLLDDLISSYGPCTPEILSGFSSAAADLTILLDRVRESMATLPLFESKRVIWIRGVQFFSPTASAGSAEIIEKILEQISRASEWSVAVFISASPVDRRLGIFKKFLAATDAYEVLASEGDAVEFLLQEMAREKKFTFDEKVHRFLLEKLGTNTRRAASELEKLDQYLGPRRIISREDVEAVLCDGAEGNFFEILDAFYSRNGPAFEKLVWAFLHGKGEPRVLLAAMQSRNRILLQMKALRQMGRWKVDGRGTPVRALLEQAREEVNFPDFPQMEKDSCNIFSQNPWYLRRVGEQLVTFQMKELVEIQLSLVEIFEALNYRWREVDEEWLLNRFVMLLR